MNDALSPLDIARHSLAHVLAQAVLEIRPDAQLAFGPPIETGCYYDFLVETPLSDADFPEIEKRMRRIVGEAQPFLQEPLTVADAINFLEHQNQPLKVEYCKELALRGETEIGFYRNGNFTDMCAGPHIEHTGKIPSDSFKVDSLAGAYWRGNSDNPQLTRIYCLAFQNKAGLADYVARRKLAQERDHRKLGKELELFMFSEEVGPGLPLWLPKGTVLREALENFAKETESRAGYTRVSTPHLAKASLYYTSGHLPYYKDSMFPPMHLEGEADYYLKSMNCPHHHMIYGNRPRSYRDLPLRFAEYGQCYRYEASGTLSGLHRVRGMMMNDAHIYCTPEQMKDELTATFQLALDYYNRFRFEGVRIRLSTHDPKNTSKFVDNPEMWSYSEKVVKDVVDALGIDYFVGEGEAAFYGPKIDFQARTILGKEESISTTQLDFAQPINFNLTYTGADGQSHRPFIVHRAPLGTHERFIAFLIEHLGGAFPTWMAPTQVCIIPVRPEEHGNYAHTLRNELFHDLVRVEVDDSENSFNKRIRAAITAKIPTILIIGAKEAESHTVTIRRYKSEKQRTIPFDEFKRSLQTAIEERSMDCFEDIDPWDYPQR